MISKLAYVTGLVSQVRLYLFTLQTLHFLTFSILIAICHSIFFGEMQSLSFVMCFFFKSITAFITNNQVIFLLCMILGKILAKWTQKMISFYISSSALKLYLLVQGDQKVCLHLTVTIQSSGGQRLFDHPIHVFFFCVFWVWIIFVTPYLFTKMMFVTPYLFTKFMEGKSTVKFHYDKKKVFIWLYNLFSL